MSGILMNVSYAYLPFCKALSYLVSLCSASMLHSTILLSFILHGVILLNVVNAKCHSDECNFVCVSFC